MRTKLILGLSSIIIALTSLPLFAAFEAHVINVTAKIENAIQATPSEITFGTVFPQEKLEKSLTISLSDSFKEQSRVSLVYYVIRQKPKCVDAQGNHPQVEEDAQGNFVCPSGSTMMPLLCPYLSKTSPKSGDQSVKPFHGSIADWTLTDTLNWEARGVLDTSDPERDASTTWTIDLKVPCFAGMCAQDWEKFVTDNGPADVVPSNYIQPAENEHKIFGCDLWIETIQIATEPSPSFCGDGAIQQPNGTGIGGPNNDGYEQCDTYDINYEGWGYHCAADCTTSRCTVGQVRPCHTQAGDGQQSCTDDGLWGECEIESGPDTTVPELTDLYLTPATFDTSTGEQVVKLVFSARDSLAGVGLDTSPNFRSPSGQGPRNVGNANLISGTRQDGTFEVELPILQFAETGTWQLTQFQLRDAVGNNRVYSRSDLISLGFTALMVYNTPKPTSYIITEVTPDFKSRGKASINNNGEIVWEEIVNGVWQIVSNTRGQITTNNTEHSHAEINDAGEIVWMERDAADYYQVVSNTRGQITSGNKHHMSPVITNSDEIIWSEDVGGYSQVMSNTRGQLTSGNVNHSEPGINSSNELVWMSRIGGNDQIFSSVRGQVTFDSYWHWRPVINDHGVMVWHIYPGGGGAQIEVSNYGVLTSGVNDHFNPSINDNGVIVYDLGVSGGYKIMMATPVY